MRLPIYRSAPSDPEPHGVAHGHGTPRARRPSHSADRARAVQPAGASSPLRPLLLAALLLAGSATACDSIFGSKGDDVTDEIIREGRIDPTQESEDGYAPVLPVWDGFDAPTDVAIGFDTFVYVTDARGLHLLDRADLGARQTLPMRGAEAVAQDRELRLFVAARDSVLIPERDNTYWDLPVVYVIEGFHLGSPVFVDTLTFPFDDFTLSTRASQLARLNRGRESNYENVRITSVATLADNALYVGRTGPVNTPGAIASADNLILEFTRDPASGTYRNVRQLRSLSPVTPSLASSIGVSGLATLVSPPQRDTFTDDRSFLLTQADPDADIPFRVLWINAVLTTDGMVYQPNRELLRRDTASADSFLYDPFKFQEPTDVAFAGDATRYLFVVDAGTHMLHQFQANGEEGITPPVGAADRSRRLNVSFGGPGRGPRQFSSPSGVAYYDRIVYVADQGNNRILRFKLTSDFE